MDNGKFAILWLIITCVSVCALVFSIFYLRTRERLASIEKGIDPNSKPERPRPAPFRSLKWGLLLVGAGCGLFSAYLLDNLVFYHLNRGFDSDANVAIYFALIAIGGGLGLITSYRIEKKELLDQARD